MRHTFKSKKNIDLINLTENDQRKEESSLDDQDSSWTSSEYTTFRIIIENVVSSVRSLSFFSRIDFVVIIFHRSVLDHKV